MKLLVNNELLIKHRLLTRVISFLVLITLPIWVVPAALMMFFMNSRQGFMLMFKVIFCKWEIEDSAEEELTRE